MSYKALMLLFAWLWLSPEAFVIAAEPDPAGTYPQGSVRELTAADLDGKSAAELSLMRNEIYARHGHIFKTPGIKAHFAAQPWYRPQVADAGPLLSPVERRNVALIRQRERGAKAPAVTEGSKYPVSWTDPRVVAALAKDCKLPDKLRGWDGDGGPGEHAPLECGPAEDQSCVVDPCFEEGEQQCKPRCAKACESCSKGCFSTCQACRRGCQGSGPECTQGCAQRCAQCHQDCVEQSDGCGSATCAQEYAACRARLKASWRKHKCPAVCKRYRACEQSGESGDCAKPYSSSGCNLELCPGEGSMGINPEE